MPMRRELGSFERAEALTAEVSPFNVVLVLRFAGGVEPPRLAAAFRTLERWHPLLRVQIARERGRHWFDDRGVGAIPLALLERAGDSAWTELVEAELMHGFEDPSLPLARVALLGPRTDGGRCEIVLTMHHAIVDATSGIRLVADLVGLLGDSTGDEEGEARSVTAGDDTLPPASDQLLPRKFRGLSGRLRLARFLSRQIAGELGHRFRTRKLPQTPSDPSARCQVVMMELGEVPTSALVRACRRHRVTLNSALYSALLIALSRHRFRQRRPLQYFQFPDLRPSLEPSPLPEVLASYPTILRLATIVAPDDDPWTLAATVNRDIYVAAKRGDKVASMLASPLLIRASLRPGAPRMGAAALGYAGAVSLESSAARCVLGLHAFVSSLSGGPELAAQARLFRSRLVWDFVYLDTDMDRESAQRIADEIRRILEDGLAGGNSPST